jgi:hypothetical protein
MHGFKEAIMHTSTFEKPCVASINGIALHTADAVLSADELRQRACAELLRQAAVAESRCWMAPNAPARFRWRPKRSRQPRHRGTAGA